MARTLPAAGSPYARFVAELKARIGAARLSAARSVNRELILLYWDIGRAIVEKQETEGWGESVVERLSADLRAEFPDMRGFSTGNLWAMRRFYVDYGRDPILQQLAEEIPWGHHLMLFDKVKAPAARLYYLRATARFNWSRALFVRRSNPEARSPRGD